MEKTFYIPPEPSRVKPLMDNSKPMIASLLAALKKDGILKTVRPASGRRSEVLGVCRIDQLDRRQESDLAVSVFLL